MITSSFINTPVILKENIFFIISYFEKKLVRFINEEIVFDAVDEVYSKDGDWTHLKEFYKKEKLPIGHKPYSVN